VAADPSTQSGRPAAVTVRGLRLSDLGPVTDIHAQVLDMEFLTRYGPAFLRDYYRAWLESPEGISLVAEDGQGQVVGALLGAVDPAVHIRGMVRGHGAKLAWRIVAHAATHPALAKDLVATRGVRYTKGLARLAKARLSSDRGSAPAEGSAADGPTIAELTHVLVRPDQQGSGAGRALVTAAVEAAAAAGRDEMVLVTPPDQAARTFYDRLGWQLDGELTSSSGEPFVRYRMPLQPSGDPID
jgi:ribosomal protein S18 acetylase RimI-like enzyme